MPHRNKVVFEKVPWTVKIDLSKQSSNRHYQLVAKAGTTGICTVEPRFMGDDGLVLLKNLQFSPQEGNVVRVTKMSYFWLFFVPNSWLEFREVLKFPFLPMFILFVSKFKLFEVVLFQNFEKFVPYTRVSRYFLDCFWTVWKL